MNRLNLGWERIDIPLHTNISCDGIMVNERITEDIVRNHFKQDPMFRNIKFDEQRTNNKILKELLKHASKKNNGKQGFPEFIITIPAIMNAVIIVECKADTRYHESKEAQSKPEQYAVDGVLHYASFLTNDFNVIAVAISGENKDNLLISNFYIKKKTKERVELTDKKLLAVYDYLNILEEKDTLNKLKNENILVFAADLNQELYDYSVPENERATIVSGILVALQDKTFENSYPIDKKPSELVEDLLTAVGRVLKANKMGEKTKILMGEYNKISQSANLAINNTIRNEETGIEQKNTLLRDIIFELDRKVFPFTEYEHIGYDILGQFYSEFIRYVYGDKKLGLVLTPQHVTELFVDIADLKVNDVLYDNCCGTGGFLIKGMKKLMELAGNDSSKKKHITEEQLIGVELRPDMFTYACSNMMMRGDGKSNIYRADSLTESSKKLAKEHKPTKGFLNPPYSTNVSELEFIYHNLDCLQESGSLCIGIVPLNCVTAQSGRDYEWKKTLMKNHTLEAVFSVPDELFYPVGTVTAIVVFKAHSPHPKDYETYFGYWKNDGFTKVKHLGRIDRDGKWQDIKADWIYNYRNRKEIKDQSIKRHVTAEDEWCAEAYMETDYSKLNAEDFEEDLKKYIMFKEMKL